MDELIVIEAPTVKAAVAAATEKLESGETSTVVATVEIPEGKENDPTWLRKQMQALSEETKRLSTELGEIRTTLTKHQEQLTLVISSNPRPTPETSPASPTSENPPEPLPLETPPEVPQPPAESAVEDRPEVETRPRRRKRI